MCLYFFVYIENSTLTWFFIIKPKFSWLNINLPKISTHQNRQTVGITVFSRGNAIFHTYFYRRLIGTKKSFRPQTYNMNKANPKCSIFINACISLLQTVAQSYARPCIYIIYHRTYNFSNLPILARLEFLRLLSAAHPTIYTFYIAFCTHVRVALFYPLTTHVGGECEAARPSDWSNYWALITDTQTHTTSGYIEISCGAAHIVFITCSWGFFFCFVGLPIHPADIRIRTLFRMASSPIGADNVPDDAGSQHHEERENTSIYI